jgi:anti-sigma factor RsiW
MADAWTEKLDIYLDGELSASEMSAFDAHVRSCPACTADVLNRLQLKRVVQAAGRHYSPASELRQRVQQLVGTRQPQRSWRWMWATAAAVAVVVVGLAVTQVGRGNLERQTFSEIADLHVAALASATPVDVISTDRHTVKPWFEGKIPFTFNLPELQNSEFTLIGGRVTYLGQMPGAHLIYRIRKHQISVFIFPEGAGRGLPGDSRAHKEATFDVASWSQAGLRYFVVGDATAEDIDKLVRLLNGTA